MVRNAIFASIALFSQLAYAGSPAIFSGSEVLLLKPNINLGRTCKILTGSDDPSVAGRAAPVCSIYTRTGTAGVYLKTDTADTDWTRLATVGGGGGGGGGILNVATKTADYTLTDSDDVILADATSGEVVLTLPDVAVNEGKVFYVKKIDESINLVTVNGGGANVEGNPTLSLSVAGHAITLISDGGAWHVF